MKVILHQEVDKLGVPGDLVEVADGYARNFLIPRKLAAPATKGGVRHAERLRRAHQDRVQRSLVEAQELAARLTANPVRIAARAGEEGRLFGSVTPQQVAAELQRVSGVEIDRKRFNLEPIRSVGTHEAVIHLHPDVNARMTIEIVPQ